ncbi:MAG: Lrp/AsnC ligand binding domain-containing protein [Candidatus Nitrosotenuis sp.]
MKKTHMIRNIMMTYSSYDIIAEIESTDMKSISEFITNTSRRIPQISTTLTLFVNDSSLF